MGVLHVTIVKIVIYVLFFFFCSLFNYWFSICWVLCKDPAHMHISLFGYQSDIRGQQRMESLFPEEETEGWGTVRDIPGITRVHKSDSVPGLFEKTGREGKVLKG